MEILGDFDLQKSGIKLKAPQKPLGYSRPSSRG